MAANNNANQVSQNIQVAVRCRPLNDREKRQNSSCVIECNEKRREVIAYDRNSPVNNNRTYTFDRVFGMNSKQIDVYNQVVRPVINEVIEGYNCTIFAYGQTGTGKTFTMEGERSPNVPDDSAWEDDPMVGIIPRSVAQLFSTLNAMTNSEFSMKVSFIELYNEELTDLLGDLNVEKSLRIYEDSQRKGSVTIPGLEEVLVKSKSEVYKILQKGADRRRKAETLMNSNSSRSHSIFTITLLIKEKSMDADSLKGEETLKIGKLNLVDLAGSENIERSGATGKRATEAGKINKSLTTLGRVITALVEHRDHIPYRESNLTRLLQDSLGGRTKTTIIATIAPTQCNFDETVSTLEYANKAKSIRNKPEINQKLVKKAVIKEFNEEIDRLKRELWAAREKNGVHLPLEIYQETQQTVDRQKEEIRELTIKNQTVGEELLKLTEAHENTKQVLEEKLETLASAERTLGETRMKLTQVEIDCDETKYLLGEHISTEKQLYSQASEVIRMFESSQQDNSFLQGKVGQLRDVIRANQNTVGSYAHETINSMDQMTREEIEAHAGNEVLVDSLMQSIQKEKEIVNGLIEDRIKPDLEKFENDQNDWLDGLRKSIEDEMKAKMESYCRQLAQKLTANMKLRTENLETCEKTCSKHRSQHDQLASSMSSVFSTHRQETLEFQRRFMAANSTWLEDTTSSVTSIGTAAQNSLTTHSNVFSTTRDQMNTLRHELNEFKSKVSERHDKMGEGLAHIIDNLGRLVAYHAETKSYVDSRLTDWDVRHTEMVRCSNLASERAQDEAQWMRRQCDELEQALRDSNESVVRAVHNEMIDLNLTYIERCENVSKNMSDNFAITNNHILDTIKKFYSFEEEKTAELRKISSESSQHLDHMCKNIQEQIEQNQKVISETLTQLSTDTIDVENTAFENQVRNSMFVTNQIKTSMDNRSQDYISFFSNGIERTGELIDKNYQAEQPTGQTPKRKISTNEPINLTKTKAHDELLESYRRRNQVEMVEEDFKEPSPVSPGPVDSSASNSSSLTMPSSKRAAYGSTNDLENMNVDMVEVKASSMTEKPSQKTLTVPKSYSKSNLLNQKKTVSNGAVLREKNQ